MKLCPEIFNDRSLNLVILDKLMICVLGSKDIKNAECFVRKSKYYLKRNAFLINWCKKEYLRVRRTTNFRYYEHKYIINNKLDIQIC
jgi:hypothetical protein